MCPPRIGERSMYLGISLGTQQAWESDRFGLKTLIHLLIAVKAYLLTSESWFPSTSEKWGSSYPPTKHVEGAGHVSCCLAHSRHNTPGMGTRVRGSSFEGENVGSGISSNSEPW